MLTNIKEIYKNAVPRLMAEFKVTNPLALIKITKVVISVGVGNTVKSGNVERIMSDLSKITGQKPVTTFAKKAVSGFKIQKGQVVGLKLTLRGARMFDFMDRLICSVLPAIRDFRGIALRSIDNTGNLNIGLKEQLIFPEISFDDAAAAHGLQITIVPNIQNRDQAIALYKLIGIPLQKE